MAKLTSMTWASVCLGMVCTVVYAGSDEQAKEDPNPSPKTISEADAVDLLAMHGMQYRDAANLVWSMAMMSDLSYAQRMAIQCVKQGVDAVPGLIALLQELGGRHAVVALEPRPGNPLPAHWSEPHIDGLVVYWFLAFFSDTRAEQAILEFFHTNATRRTTDTTDSDEFEGLLNGLGWQKTEGAVSLLVRMLERDYWVREFGLVIDCNPKEPHTKEELNEGALRLLRDHVLTSLSYSGTDRALEMLATGKGLPEDLKPQIADLMLFRVAVRARVGLVGYPELEGQVLAPDKISEMTELFCRYGLTYTEDPLIEKMKDFCE